MGKVSFVIGDELEKEFRVEVAKRLGGKKGDQSKAIEEAIKLWLKEKNKS